MKQIKRLGDIARATFIVCAVALMSTACTAATGDEGGTGASADEIKVGSSFTSRGTGYFPDSSALEGGFKDRVGKPLHTLQQFLSGSAPYVAVAMDSNAFKYGTRLRIRELETEHGKAIIFRVVDTGGAFRGKGRSRIDICTASNKASLDPVINATLHIDVIDETGGGALPPVNEPPAGNGGGTPQPAPAPAPAPAPGDPGGATCSGDGICNPGNDGAGMICTAGHCVKGCHNSNQCPGSQTCSPSGQCQ